MAYSILGTVTKDITTESLGTDQDGNEVYLRDIWPSNQEISEAVSSCVTREMFIEKYQSVFDGEAGNN